MDVNVVKFVESFEDIIAKNNEKIKKPEDSETEGKKKNLNIRETEEKKDKKEDNLIEETKNTEVKTKMEKANQSSLNLSRSSSPIKT